MFSGRRIIAPRFVIPEYVIGSVPQLPTIKREANPGDRRSLLVRISAARHKRVTSSYESARKQFEQALREFSDQELDTILRFFAAINSAQVPVNRMDTDLSS